MNRSEAPNSHGTVLHRGLSHGVGAASPEREATMKAGVQQSLFGVRHPALERGRTTATAWLWAADPTLSAPNTHCLASNAPAPVETYRHPRCR
jgi:hypothetical protein